MNPLALCALLSISCAAPKARSHYEVLGMVAGPARQLMQADWDATAKDSSAPERMYEVLRDSVGAWLSGKEGTDTLVVLYVLEVQRIPAKYADPLSIVPSYMPTNPTIHTHQNYCQMTHWGPQYDTCSNSIPQSHQCHASTQDLRVQKLEGHGYDVVQCDRSAWVFYLNPEIVK